jgi:hypothetical protein
LTTREEELTALGWQKKSITSEPRLSELVQIYHRIGCDVHLEPFDPFGAAGLQGLHASGGRKPSNHLHP